VVSIERLVARGLRNFPKEVESVNVYREAGKEKNGTRKTPRREIHVLQKALSEGAWIAKMVEKLNCSRKVASVEDFGDEN
jgi:hypothetical protein